MENATQDHSNANIILTDDMNDFGKEIIHYLNKHHIKHFPINLQISVNGEKKPKPMSGGNGFIKEYKTYRNNAGKITNTPRESDFLAPHINKKGQPVGCTDEEIKARHKWYSIFDYMAIDTNQIKQIDIDSPDYDERIQHLVEIACCFRSLTKPFGRHIFIKCDHTGKRKSDGTLKGVDWIDDIKSLACPNEEYCKENNWNHDKKRCKYHGKKKIEILQGKWSWACIKIKLINKGEPVCIENIKDWVIKEEEREVRNEFEEMMHVVRNAPVNPILPYEINKWVDYANIISNDIWGDNAKWYKITCSAKHIGIPYEKYDGLAKLKPGYNANENQSTWNSIDNTEAQRRKCRWQTIYEYAEESDEEAKEKLDITYVVFERFQKFHFENLKDEIKVNVYMAKKQMLEDKAEELLEATDDTKKEIQDCIKKLKRELKEDYKKMLYGNFEKKKKYFEKFHFKIMSPFGIGRQKKTKVGIYDDAIFKKMYRNLQMWYIGRDGKAKFGRFTDNWLDQLKVKTFEEVDFCPYPLEKEDDCFNLFNGLSAEHFRGSREDCDISIFLNHIKILGGKSKVVKGLSAYDYIVSYLAHIVQFPGKIPEVGLIFKGLQGTGKSMFFEGFGRMILGNMYTCSTARVDDIIGRFCAIKHKLIVILDETDGKDTFVNNGKIKNFISQPRIPYEAKHKDTIDINNCARMIFLTNNNTPVCIELSDRRFCLFIVNAMMKGNVEYFDKLAGAFKDKDMVYSFYTFLKNYPLKDFKIEKDRCLTADYYGVRSHNIPLLWRFMAHIVQIPDVGTWGVVQSADDYYNNEESDDGNESPIDLIEQRRNGMSKDEWDMLPFNHLKIYKSSRLYSKFQHWLNEYSSTKSKEFTTINSFGRGMSSLTDEWGEITVKGDDREGGKYYHIDPQQVRFKLKDYKEFLYN